MRHTLKAPGSKRVKLEYEKLLSNFAFDFNLRRYTVHHQHQRQVKHGPPPPPPPPPLPPPPPHHTKPKPTVVKAYALPEVTTVLASRLRFAARQFFQAADSGGHGDLTRGDTDAAILLAWGRGLHSSTFQLNLSAFCVTGVQLGVVAGVFRGY